MIDKICEIVNKEAYDEIIRLKKQINNINKEASTYLNKYRYPEKIDLFYDAHDIYDFFMSIPLYEI